MQFLNKTVLAALFLAFVFSIPAKAQPASWTIQDEDTAIHLFGTFHMAPEGQNWLSDRLLTKLKDSRQLFLELNPDELTMAEQQQIVIQSGSLPQGKVISDVISPETLGLFQSYLSAQGMSLVQVERMRPWFVATQLTVMRLQQLGLTTEHGSETLFIVAAKKHGIPIAGLETFQQQMDVFSTMSVDQEENFLLQTLAESAELEQMTKDLTDAWLTGDLVRLEKLLTKGFADDPDMADRILYKRNRDWVVKIKRILQHPGVFFIAVGAGHLVGERGVPALLAKDRITVYRKQ